LATLRNAVRGNMFVKRIHTSMQEQRSTVQLDSTLKLFTKLITH